MEISELKGWVKETSRRATARFGSYGEFVFEQVAKARCQSVETIRRNEFDFLLDGRIQVDVKSTAKSLEQSAGSVRCLPYKGRRLPKIDYVRVEFLSDGARISQEGQLWAMVSWATLLRDYERWEELRSGKGKKPSGKKVSKPDDGYGALRAQIVAIAKSHGRKARVIHRTCQTRFGYSNPPHNVIGVRHRYDLHIFVSFRDSDRRAENIERIFAFPDEVADSLPRRQMDSLSKGVAKIDLTRVDERFSFDSMKEFQSGLERVF